MEELKNRLTKLNNQLGKVDKKMKKLMQSDPNWFYIYNDELKDLRITESNILKAIDECEHKLFALTNKAETTDGEIDLYLIYEDEYKSRYSIFLHDTNIYIGYINYSKNHSQGYKETFGDVSYMILPDYRGNNFAFLALTLMADLLYKKGVSELFIAAEEENIPSIRTIEKFGGIPISSRVNGIKSYRCDLSMIIKHTDGRS